MSRVYFFFALKLLQPQVRKGRASSSPGVLPHTNLAEGGRQSAPTRAPPLRAPPPPELLGDQAPPPRGNQVARLARPGPPLSTGCSSFPRLAPPRRKAPLSSLCPGPHPLHRGPADHQSQATSSLQGTSPGTQPHPLITGESLSDAGRARQLQSHKRRCRPMKPPPVPLQGRLPASGVWAPGAGAAALPQEHRPSAHPLPSPGADGHI